MIARVFSFLGAVGIDALGNCVAVDAEGFGGSCDSVLAEDNIWCSLDS